MCEILKEIIPNDQCTNKDCINNTNKNKSNNKNNNNNNNIDNNHKRKDNNIETVLQYNTSYIKRTHIATAIILGKSQKKETGCILKLLKIKIEKSGAT